MAEREGIDTDKHFIHCGGKQKMPKVIYSLKELEVPLKVIVDFDLLRDSNEAKRIFIALGGDWSVVEGDFNLVHKSIEDKKSIKTIADVQRDIAKTIRELGDTSKSFKDEHKIEINKVIKDSTVWEGAKENGKSFIPGGGPTLAFERLDKKFKEIGLHILHVGEVECFCKKDGSSNKKAKWLNNVLQRDLAKDTELEEARKFVRHVFSK